MNDSRKKPEKTNKATVEKHPKEDECKEISVEQKIAPNSSLGKPESEKGRATAVIAPPESTETTSADEEKAPNGATSKLPADISPQVSLCSTAHSSLYWFGQVYNPFLKPNN